MRTSAGKARRAIGAAGVIALLAGTASAVPPTPRYESHELQARSNFSGTFNLPASAFFTNSTPSINRAGQVTIHISVIGGSDSKGIFIGAGGVGEIEYLSPAGASLSDATINDAGVAVFPQTFSPMNGIYQATTASSGFVTNQPLGTSVWGTPQINTFGEIGFRAGFSGGQAWVSYSGGATAVHAAEAAIQPGSPYSFLFTPSFNDERRIAGKVRLGAPGQTGNERPDEIRVFASDGSFTIIARDRDADPASPYAAFDNSVSLTDEGWVAFTANLVAGGRGVFLSNGVETRTIAVTGGEVSDIEFFAPSANERGHVCFRARDAMGLRAVWVGNGTTLTRVATEHDIVPSDLGDARIDQHDSSPVFGGNPSMNACGDVAFHASLTPPSDNQVEWGSGLYVAYASPNADVNEDGVVDILDFLEFIDLFGQQHPDAELTCDGAVDVLDLLEYLDAFGMAF